MKLNIREYITSKFKRNNKAQQLQAAEERLKALEKEQDESIKHNKEVLKKLYQDVENTFMSNYWSGDITQYMRKEMFGGHYAKITKLFNEALRQIK